MEDISSNDIGKIFEHRARIYRFRRNSIILNFVILFASLVFCIILLTRIESLEKEIESLREEIKSEEKDSGSKEPEKQTPAGVEDSSENKVSNNKKAVYLTFDDGPSDNTYNILDILDRYKVKATFFVNGKEDDKYKALYKEITDRGSSLGMHSYTHDVKIVYGSLESFAEDTEKIHDYLYNLTGKNITLYRFPGGSSTKNTSNISQYIDYLNVKGYTYYDWNVSSGDAVKEELSAEIIVSNVMNGVKEKNGGIVLLHDSAAKDTTVEALPIIIEKLLNEGYEILPILDTTPPVQHRGNETLGG